jgi:hypothetical protein
VSVRTIIVCRARVSRACLHGQPSRKQFGAGYMEGVPDPPLSEDGTFDGESICCDPCYLALGGPLNAELPGAIERWRDRRAASGE